MQDSDWGNCTKIAFRHGGVGGNYSNDSGIRAVFVRETPEKIYEMMSYIEVSAETGE